MFETFTPEEAEKLAPYFTNSDKQVFAIKNMDPQVAGIMFARYSRYAGGLRRMFLDEFVNDFPAKIQELRNEGAHTEGLYARIVGEYGDDSVLQTLGAHVGLEFVSNLMTKVIERGRLAAYLEQSTRYIDFSSPVANGDYRFHHFDPEFDKAMNFIFDTYVDILPKTLAWVREAYPIEDGQSQGAYNMATKAKALDLVRGILPASTLSHVGMFASGQAYENLLHHMFANPLPESQHLAQMLLDELKQVIPHALSRVEREDRGGEWINFLKETKETSQMWAHKLGIGVADAQPSYQEPSVKLIEVYGTERDVAAALLKEGAFASENDIRTKVNEMNDGEVSNLIEELVGHRLNRRHKAGRGYEAVNYRMEIISDYGSYRDLQRHRMMSMQWESLTPYIGAEIPEELHKAGVADQFKKALEVSQNEYERLFVQAPHLAPYALCLAYRIRYTMHLNAREAMQMLELRSQTQGHPNYRETSKQMYREIEKVHPTIAKTMRYVNLNDNEDLERLQSELAQEKKRNSQS